MTEDGVVQGVGVKHPIPNCSLATLILDSLSEASPERLQSPWMVDCCTGRRVLRGEVEEKSRRIASALAKRGFSEGDILYFVSHEMAFIYLALVAVWRLGGAVRGYAHEETPEEYEYQMRELKTRIIIVDDETVAPVREAARRLEWDVKFINIGPRSVEDAEDLTVLLEDDGSACPERVPACNPEEDVAFIASSNGSTGRAKGILHTHRSSATFAFITRDIFHPHSIMTSTPNFSSINLTCILHGLLTNCTVLNFSASRFTLEKYCDVILRYQCEDTMTKIRDACFLEVISIGGWTLDGKTIEFIKKQLPKTEIWTMYGLTEISFASHTIKADLVGRDKPYIEATDSEGTTTISSGKLLPHVEGKVVDIQTGETLKGCYQIGSIRLRSPSLMKGYILPNNPMEKPNRDDIDADGFMKTGDIGFFDDEGNIYVKERKGFLFKYCMRFVSPSEVEAVLCDHPAVQSAGLAPIPHVDTDTRPTALVILRPGYKESDELAAELIAQVAERLPEHKHLRGGVRFVSSLPLTRGGKLNRRTLLKQALELMEK